jgi:hypothetical protein
MSLANLRRECIVLQSYPRLENPECCVVQCVILCFTKKVNKKLVTLAYLKVTFCRVMLFLTIFLQMLRTQCQWNAERKL